MSAATAAERELERYICSGATWERLPATAKALVDNSPAKFAAFVARFALARRLPWGATPALRDVVADERRYVEELLRRSRASLMVFPYHLSADIARIAPAWTPFAYYLEMMLDVMLSDRSYDTLPNFTAADGVRLLGVGRNEFIDVMNRFRARGWAQLIKKRRTALRALLPRETVFRDPEHWWVVHPVAAAASGAGSEDELRGCCDDAERATLSALRSNGGGNVAGAFEKAAIVSLHRRGLVWLTAPVGGSDLVSIPPLENFVMNRVQGDHFENLLYDVFVSIDGRTTVDQLADVLQVSPDSVAQAVSLFCLLGMAKNKSADVPRPGGIWHESWISKAVAASSSSSPQSSSDRQSPSQQQELDLLLAEDSKRIGLVFDSTLTAFLMMGNLGSGLKMHAVTMFEVGKLADETMDDFIGELDKVVSVAEGEAQRYADHAICLGQTLKFLRRNPEIEVFGSAGGIDLLRCERLNALDRASLQRMLSKNYSILVSMAPITAESTPVCSVAPHHFGPPIPEANSLWMRMFVRMVARSGPACALFVRGTRIRRIPAVFRSCKSVLLHSWGHEGVVHNLTQLLPVLNSRLQSSPVLVEAYSYSSVTAVPEHYDVPLPFTPEAAAESPNAETVRRLNEELSLDLTCGYLRLVRVPGAPVGQWDVDHLALGIPLFSTQLNAAVCKIAAEKHLFSEASLTCARDAMQGLATRLLDFIVRTQDPSLASAASSEIAAVASGASTAIVQPSRHLVFANGVLTTHDAW